MKRYARFKAILMLYALIFSVVVDAAACDGWPQGLVFVGLVDTEWQTYAVTRSGREPEKIDLNAEARTPVYLPSRGLMLYVDEAGQVNQFSLEQRKTRTLLAPSNEAAYAQPEFDHQDNAIYVVQLKQGKSVDTDIIRLDLSTGITQAAVVQRSAQFEPRLAQRWLYYSNVHCVVGCGKIIQEIWRYHTISGIAEQLTLLNSISRQPVVDGQGAWLYFSSNAAGNYHIYRQPLADKDAALEKLTTGGVTDMSPAVTSDSLYFIRYDSQGARLMCSKPAGEVLVSLALPPGVKDIRDLEIH